MSCACIKKYFDANIEYRDCKTLIYEDQSDWMSGEAYEGKPDSYEVTVYVPSRKKEVTIELDPSKRNIITSVELFGTGEPICLPDDIYCFTTTSCGISYKINRAFVCRQECRLDELTSKAKTKDDFREVMFFRNMIDSVKINSKLGKPNQAKELLQIVSKKLKHLTCAEC